MAVDDRLKEYKKKRDLSKTPEPRGEKKKKKKGGDPAFVIQKHDARNLHYDFRLEADGVLVSWAVPKGPSTNPDDRRLAIKVEDHPIDYGDFEGVIPKGMYGAGTVLVWDRGTYRNLMAEKDPPISVQESIEIGHVEVWLEGGKLRGGYALVEMKGRGVNQWLLIKMKDEFADRSGKLIETDPNSVVSGASLDEIRKRVEGSKARS
jgi:DNA ligase D-like protein (predicted 3'-phosphoesterase)